MRITNTTKMPTEALRRCAVWCAQQVGCSTRKIRSIHYRSRKYGLYSGHCHVASGVITCSVGNTGAGSLRSSLGKVYTPKELFEGRVQSVVEITAHEIAHRQLYLEGSETRYSRRYGTTSGGGSEKQTRWLASRVFQAFEKDAENLLRQWIDIPEPKAKAKPNLQEKRAAHVDKKLAEWEKKLKTAQRKVKEYRKKARYYERAMAKRKENQ